MLLGQKKPTIYLYEKEKTTYENYKNLLQIAKNNFVFRSFTELNKNDNYIIWRHDVDFSMHSARNLAIIEAEEGIKSTYFLNIHSEFYNLMEKEIANCVRNNIDCWECYKYLGIIADEQGRTFEALQYLQKYLTNIYTRDLEAEERLNRIRKREY